MEGCYQRGLLPLVCKRFDTPIHFVFLSHELTKEFNYLILNIYILENPLL